MPEPEKAAFDVNVLKKRFIKTLHEIGPDTRDVFDDYLLLHRKGLMSTYHGETKEDIEEYKRITKKYGDKSSDFTYLIATTIFAMVKTPYTDFLGKIIEEEEMLNKWVGQYFTPESVAQLIAGTVMPIDSKMVKEKIAKNEVIKIMDPAVGSGRMLLASVNTLMELRFPRNLIYLQGTDIDNRAANIAFIQLSHTYCRVEIVHGNSLSGETWATYRNFMTSEEVEKSQKKSKKPKPKKNPPSKPTMYDILEQYRDLGLGPEDAYLTFREQHPEHIIPKETFLTRYALAPRRKEYAINIGDLTEIQGLDKTMLQMLLQRSTPHHIIINANERNIDEGAVLLETDPETAESVIWVLRNFFFKGQEHMPRVYTRTAGNAWHRLTHQERKTSNTSQ